MIKKIISSLGLILFLVSAPISGVSANSNFDFRTLDFTGIMSSDNKLSWSQHLSVKKSVPYDESKDPTLRNGTENWEEPQGSFFAIPALIVGAIALFLFFNREK
jgi:hypothetical protein